MINVRDIHTYYGESYILQGVSLALERGKVVGLLGRNGVGKSTLVRSIMGMTPPRRGTVSLDDRDVTKLATQSIVKLGVGMVPQERRIFKSLTVEENLTINERGNGNRKWTLDRVYELFPVLKARSRNRGNLLSGGEQQMLAVARALMGNPDYLLMDEPSEGLAPLIVRQLGEVIDILKQEGMGILLIEQHMNFVIKHANIVFIMSKGALVHESQPQDLAANREIQRKYLGI